MLSRIQNLYRRITVWPRIMNWKFITVAARSKEWTVFARSNAGIVISNPNQGMDVCVRLYFVIVLSCVYVAVLRRAYHSSKETHCLYKIITKLKQRLSMHWWINWKWCGRGWPWQNLRYILAICLEWLKKQIKDFNHDNLSRSRFEPGTSRTPIRNFTAFGNLLHRSVLLAD
jgi:hypothetical protein